MDGQTFDELIRATMQTATRRGALGVFAGAALSGLAWFDLTEAKKRRRKNKKKKKKKGGNNPSPAGGCSSAAECGAGQACQGGLCVPVSPPPPPPECVNDNDCGNNEVCQSGGCICPEVLENRCVVRCSESAACPGNCLCRGLFPGDGQPRVVCVDEPFDLCGTPSCTNSGQCDNDEICVFTTCGSSAGSGRCFPVCVE